MAHASFLGLEPSQVIGKYTRDLFPPEDEQEIVQIEQQIIENHQPISYQQTLKNSLGESLWFITSKIPIFDENGNIFGIFGISKDITDLKKTQMSLAESEERLERAEKVAKIGHWKLNMGTMQMTSSKGACKLYGVPEDSMSLSDVQKIPLKEYRQNLDQALINLIHHNKPYYQEFKICRQNDGKIIDIKSIAEYDKTLNIIFGVIQDITESKKTEMLLKEKNETIEAQNEEYLQINEELQEINLLLVKAKEQIEESENKFRTITTQASEGIVLTDIHGKYVLVNPAFCDLTGYKEDELLSMSVSDLITKNHIPLFYENKNLLDGFPLIVNFLRKDGSEFYGEVIGRIIRLKNEDFILGTIRDITDRQKAAEEMLLAKEKAEESDRLKTAFLQNISHEIRTPMNAIMGFTGLLVENYSNKEKLERFTEIILQRCSDLLGIINDILEIAKIESGQLPVYLEPCDVEFIFSELSTLFLDFQHKNNKNQIELTFRSFLRPEENIILSDKIKLKQIFINLISNAFKFTESGSIHVTANLKDHSIVFSVTDTGIGIKKENHEIIFQRFTQLNPFSNQMPNGTGLGLSIVKGLIELLHGKIWLESQEGIGSIFSFSLPFQAVNPLPEDKQIPWKEIKVDFTGKTVLVVEDDYYNAKYLKEVLSPTGIRILETSLGREAIRLAQEENPDIVLMDIRLPDIDGYETTKIIKNLRPQQRIIAQTAYAAQDERHNALNAGCVDYLKKPIEKHLLLNAMSIHLNNK